MVYNFIDEIVNLPINVLNSDYWDDDDLTELDKAIAVIGIKFQNELNDILFGKNIFQKEDITRDCLTAFGEIYNHIFSTINPDDSNFKAISKVRQMYNDQVDHICELALKNKIDLQKIVDGNHLIEFYIDISLYRRGVRDSLRSQILLKHSNESKLKNAFKSIEYYNLFMYLHKDTSKHSHDIKYSCIYRLFTKEGYLELEAEKYRTILSGKPFEKNIKFNLYTLKAIGNRTITYFLNLMEKYKNEI